MFEFNKSHNYFYLTDTGWVSHQSNEEITSDDAFTLVGSVLTLKVTHYTHEESPVSWYRAIVVDVCDQEDKSFLRKRFEQFPIPNLVQEYCWVQIEHIKQHLAD